MGALQKWLTLTAGLGAAYMVLTHPAGFAALAAGTQRIVGGTVTQISTGGAKGA